MPTWTSLGVNTFQYTNGNGQDFLRNGTAGWSSNQLTGAFYVATPSVSQDFDWNKGSHSRVVRRRVDPAALRWRRHVPVERHSSTFSGLITSGTSNANGGLNMADFVLGLPSAFSQGGSQINDQVLHSVGLYVAGRVARHQSADVELRLALGTVSLRRRTRTTS